MAICGGLSSPRGAAGHVGVTAGNMDSLVNHYTSDRKIRSDDAYTAGGEAGRRPDRAVAVYAHRCREAAPGVPVIVGGIEASLRRVAHYDYWSDKVRKSVLIDSKADLLLFGNAERAICKIAERLAAGESIREIRDLRGTAYLRDGVPDGWFEQDTSTVDTPGPVEPLPNPYEMTEEAACDGPEQPSPLPGSAATSARTPRTYGASAAEPRRGLGGPRPVRTRLQGGHREANPHNARALIQRQGGRDVWINPPPMPLSTPEMDAVYELPFQRRPHPGYGDAKIPPMR